MRQSFKARTIFALDEWINNMKLIFENWNNYLNERRNSSERQFREAVVDFVVGQMRTMGMNAGEASDRARIQKEVHSIVDLAMEQCTNPAALLPMLTLAKNA